MSCKKPHFHTEAIWNICFFLERFFEFFFFFCFNRSGNHSGHRTHWVRLQATVKVTCSYIILLMLKTINVLVITFQYFLLMMYNSCAGDEKAMSDNRDFEDPRTTTAAKISLKKLIRVHSKFIATVVTHLLSQMYANSPGVEFLKTISKLRMRKKIS